MESVALPFFSTLRVRPSDLWYNITYIFSSLIYYNAFAAMELTSFVLKAAWVLLSIYHIYKTIHYIL